MKRYILLTSYFLVITLFTVISALGKFSHSPGKTTIAVGLILSSIILFLSYILIKYDIHVNVLLWLPLFVILSNLAIQLTGGISHSMFIPLYFFLVIIVALKSKISGIILSLTLIFFLETISAFLKQRISLHFSIILITLIGFSFLLSYFIENLKRKKKEIETKLKDIEKTSSVLTTPASTTDRNELLKTFKNRKDGYDLKAREKMSEFIEPIINAVFQTIPSHSSVIFMKDEKKDSFFLFKIKSHSAYINDNAVITRRTGTYSLVIKSEKPLLNNQFLLDSKLLEYYTKDEDIRSIIIIPLLEEREFKGLLICDSKEENMFNWETKEKLKVYGSLIISTVSLFRRIYKAQVDAIKYSALQEIAQKLSKSLESSKVLDILSDIAPKAFNFHLLVLILYGDNQKPVIHRTILSGEYENTDKFAYLNGAEVSLDGSLAGLVIEKNHWVIKQQKIKTPFFFKNERWLGNFQSFFGVPLHKDENVSGELVLMSKNQSEYPEEHTEPVIFLADLISVALEKAKLYQETKALSIRDGLTGAFNHKHFQEKLIKELQRAKRSGNHFSLLMFDIDHFKGFNDNYGHQTGDRVLKHISEIIMNNVRSIDTFARYGGEEFIIILPDTEKKDAISVAEKLRVIIEKKPLIIKENIYSVTISIGCAIFPFDGEDKDTLISKADKALYKAKQDGRNLVRSS
ncbi:sensor domain-containing diguanylate cyclase [candidate division WOR-3 bacterium]|nr:sensor domain-containing diguanylate cyclase [candidate division WOR-3 bacterium]